MRIERNMDRHYNGADNCNDLLRLLLALAG
jgi:hypothetical protein